MKVSIISPSYNQARYLGQMMSSVSRQSYQNYEHIILDPGSTDDSRDILHSFAKDDNRINLVLKNDYGQVDAINKGLFLSCGDILTWLNTDDRYFDEHVLHTVIDYFNRNPEVDIAYGRGIRIDDQGNRIREAFVHPRGTSFPEALEYAIGLLQPSVFFRRDVYEKAGGLDPAWPLQLDYELWIRYAQNGFRFGFIDRLLSMATVHDQAKSTLSRQNQLNECLALISSRFGYVASDWISRYAEFYLTRRDAKVDGNIILDSSQKSLKSGIERDLHRIFNSPAIREGRLSPVTNFRRKTLESMIAMDVSPPAPARLIVTSFDSHYFLQGLNLIASLHRTSIDSFNRIIVYPLNLTEYERDRLSDLEKVELIDYPENIRSQTFQEFLDPKTRAYKSYAMRAIHPLVASGDLILWMDAGLSVLQDIDAVFRLISKHEFFITDHDDSQYWPFFNISFMHPECRKVVKPTNKELLAPHLCSAMVGYRSGGRYQHLIDEAWEYGRIREAVLWPKVMTPGEAPSLTQNDDLRSLNTGGTNPDTVPVKRQLSVYGYHGHRTQSILSVLANRSQAPVFSGKTYRCSNVYSSEAARRNWQGSARETDKLADRRHLDGISKNTIVYHHRGTYNHLEGMQFTGIAPELFILGNGPSLRNFDFHQLRAYDTLGMNAAYRFWETCGFYPSYYACFDTVVQCSHHEAIRRLISERDRNGIRKFFLRECILDQYPELSQISCVFLLEDLQRQIGWFARDKITTGSFSVLVGLFLGYRQIYLLGIDLNYVEKLPEAKVDGESMEIVQTPLINPNYFFDGYQVKGDRYNPPNRHPDMHLRSWQQLREFLEKFPASVVNLNPNSAVREFPFNAFENVHRMLRDPYRLAQTTAERAIHKSTECIYWRQELLDHLTTIVQENSAIKALHGRLIDDRVFDRAAGARIDEARLISYLYQVPLEKRGVMIDIGAHHGGSARWFLEKGWKIYCFEPDPDNRSRLNTQLKGMPEVVIDPRAVGSKASQGALFYRSRESSGISSLHPFHDSHVPLGKVDITTVTMIVEQYNITRIDFLKIDVEGTDYEVLKGVPWSKIKPEIIECEFEDAKTLPLGHNWRDIAEFLVAHGYTIYISEWHPIIRYGIRHHWRALKRYPCELEESGAWGNLLAFRSDPGLFTVEEALNQCLDYAGKNSQRKIQSHKRGLIIDFERLMNSVGQKLYDMASRTVRASGSPTLYRLGKFMVWLWPRLKWHATLLVSLITIAIIFLLVSLVPGMSDWEIIFLGLSAATLAIGIVTITGFGLRGWLRRRLVRKGFS